MREYKFRAWDKEKGIMFDVFSFDPNHVIPWGIDKHTIPPNREDVILMQSTGLKDKNGTEIYEGDILKVYDTFKKKWFTAHVQYAIGTYFVYVNGEDRSECVWSDYKSEVIGNIFENPDLLEAKE